MTRAYHSPRREEQARRTRELIVEALIEQLCDSGRTDFSIAEVAERAGIAVRTIYRHFPTRDDLLAAINDHFESHPMPEDPRDPADLQRHTAELFCWFEDNAQFIEASHLTNIGREVRSFGRRGRSRRIKQLIDRWTDGLSDADRRRAWAVFRTMFGSFTWKTMRHELGLTLEETIDAVDWVMGLVVDDLQRRRSAGERSER